MAKEQEIHLVHRIKVEGGAATVNAEKSEDFSVREAQLEHDHLDALRLASGRLTGDLGVHAIKAPGFAAAASAVALLGYVSANYATVSEQLPKIMNIMIWLLIAVGLSTIAHGGAYLSQFAFFQSLSSEKKSFSAPYRIRTAKNVWIDRLGHGLHAVTALLVVGAYISLVVAGVNFLRFFGASF